jgi:hypothetical protein
MTQQNDDDERQAREWEVETIYDFAHGTTGQAAGVPRVVVGWPYPQPGVPFEITCVGCGAAGVVRLHRCDSVHTCFLCLADTYVRYVEDEHGFGWERMPAK